MKDLLSIVGWSLMIIAVLALAFYLEYRKVSACVEYLHLTTIECAMGGSHR